VQELPARVAAAVPGGCAASTAKKRPAGTPDATLCTYLRQSATHKLFGVLLCEYMYPYMRIRDITAVSVIFQIFAVPPTGAFRLTPPVWPNMMLEAWSNSLELVNTTKGRYEISISIGGDGSYGSGNRPGRLRR